MLGDSLGWPYPDDEHSELEQCWIMVGQSETGRIVVVAHTDEDEETIRIISARRATRKEREFYEEG